MKTTSTPDATSAILAWDPSCAPRLVVMEPAPAAVNDPQSSGGDNNQHPQQSQQQPSELWASSSGCHRHELAALIEILQAHKEYHHQTKQDAPYDNHVRNPAAGLARTCRAALSECLARWEGDHHLLTMTTTTLKDDHDATTQTQQQQQNDDDAHHLELLKLTLAVLHLSDIFVPLLSQSSASLRQAARPLSSLWYDNNNENDNPLLFGGSSMTSIMMTTDPFQQPGAVTAPLVRFLRYHYDSPALLHPQLPQLLSAQQPEAFCCNDNGNSEEYQDEGSLYWAYITTLVLRGCLRQAWAALQRHSLYQTALRILRHHQDTTHNSTTNSNHHHQDPLLTQRSQEIVQQFGVLKQTLRCAPLPGGRDDAYDDAIVLADHDDFMEQDDDDMPLPTNNDDIDPLESYYNTADLVGLSVAPDDYQLWEPQPPPPPHNHRDTPLVFDGAVAHRKHEAYQHFVRTAVVPHLAPLLSRIPELKTAVLDILSGQQPQPAPQQQQSSTPISWGTSTTWAEALLATLLYQCPQLTPRKLPGLARQLMQEQQHQQGNSTAAASSADSLNEILLDIMKGKASEAIDALYTLGGATGAALPSTLLAVIYTLYLDANILTSQAGSFRQTEFLCEAANSIVASIVKNGTESTDTATFYAVQLLLPHCPNNEDVRLCLVQILERYYPKSDAGARNIVKLVASLVMGVDDNLTGKGSNIISVGYTLPLVEACEAVLLCRYRFYMQDGQPGTAALWLVEGMEFRANMMATTMISKNNNKSDEDLSAATSGSCHRTLCALCNTSTSKLLRILTASKGTEQESQEYSAMYRDTVDIVESIAERSASMLADASLSASFAPDKVPEVQVMFHVAELVELFVISKEYDRCAKLIVACLSETNPNNASKSLIPFSLHWPLLLIAREILRTEESVDVVTNAMEPQSAFDHAGIGCLLQSLMRVVNLSCSNQNGDISWGPSSDEELLEVQELLARALGRAFVVENRKKKDQKQAARRNASRRGRSWNSTTTADISAISSKDLSSYSAEIQQDVVLNMLNW